jgi:hypothetical protein
MTIPSKVLHLDNATYDRPGWNSVGPMSTTTWNQLLKINRFL